MDINYEIAKCAVEENEAWKARNAARNAFRDLVRGFRHETGEYVDRSVVEQWDEPEELAKFDRLQAAKKEAQRILQNKRAATRRIIAVLTD